MNFRFGVRVSEEDYVNYNTFVLLRSPYGKKQILSLRVATFAVFAIISLIAAFGENFTWVSLIGPVVILLVFQFFLTRFFAWSLKGYIRSMKKQGKMAYSPEAVLEFYDDTFVEITAENKTEQRYAGVERISIVDGNMIYIHVNNTMAYMLPFASFESTEHKDQFVEFIKTKCAQVDVY